MAQSLNAFKYLAPTSPIQAHILGENGIKVSNHFKKAQRGTLGTSHYSKCKHCFLRLD